MAKPFIPYDGPVVTRAEALASGLKRYFTGVPCMYGHLEQMVTSGRRCMECCRISLRGRDKSKTAARTAQFHIDNPEWRPAYNAAYREANRDTLSAYAAVYYKENRESLKAAAREYRRKPEQRLVGRLRSAKRRSCPVYSLNKRISGGMRKSLGSSKSGRSWQSMVGYTVEQLRVHIERQFTKGMSWTNISKWHIDHIVPLSSFSFTSSDDDEFKAAWALTNLRPLWSLKNISKGAKREFLI